MPKPSLLVLCLLVLLAAWNLIQGGGLSSNLGGDPDEPAHAVTSLMVRDYLAGGFLQNPASFAKRYYADFPKVALGHYPPGYYLLGGLALLVWPQPITLIVLQAVLAFVLGLLTWRLGRHLVSEVAAVAAAAVVILLPLMAKIQSHAMADLMLGVLVCLSAAAWVRFLQDPKAASALAFGFLAATAILTKGSALMLGAVPVFSILLLRRWDLLKNGRWWLAGVPVGLLAFPWMLLTAKITREGMVDTTLSAFLREAVPAYLQEWRESHGLLLMGLALAGLLALIIRALHRRLSESQAVLLSLLGGGAAILLLVPAGITSRYLAPLVPALAILAVIGAELLLPRLMAFMAFIPADFRRLAAWATVPLFVAASTAQPWMNYWPKAVHGFSEAVTHALPATAKATPSAQAHWLVSSDPRGEGAIIAEAAFRLPARAPSTLRIHRASKDLAVSDWMGRGYQMAARTEADLLARLDELHVSTVFLDQSMRESQRVGHHDLLQRALRSVPDRWQLAQTVPITRLLWEKGELQVYQRTTSASR